MKIISRLFDKRINAINVQIEINASDYIGIAKDILKNNELQRKRVKQSGSIYSLLKSDILSGCLIPPIVLALRIDKTINIGDITDDYIKEVFTCGTRNLLILDGLQRTYSLLDVFTEHETNAALKEYVIRLEIYFNITEVGVLYRMLTLNAGQTPMSLRHQIEILYSNFAGKTIGEINVLRQTDDSAKKKLNDYNYVELIEGYNSFLERNESPIDRFSLLDIVQSIGKISNDTNDRNSFSKFAVTYYNIVKKIQITSNEWVYPEIEEDVPAEFRIQGLPFGSTPFKIFNKTQALTGFGAAIGSLIDQKAIENLDEISSIADKISILDPNKELLLLNKCLDEIKQEAKRIGNAQRLYFRYFFKNIFDKTDNESFLKFEKACEVAKKRTLANM